VPRNPVELFRVPIKAIELVYWSEQVDAESPACLDGSDYGVYFRGNASSTKWTVFLEGGGWYSNVLPDSFSARYA
jgi:hypothetical protein